MRVLNELVEDHKSRMSYDLSGDQGQAVQICSKSSSMMGRFKKTEKARLMKEMALLRQLTSFMNFGSTSSLLSTTSLNVAMSKTL